MDNDYNDEEIIKNPPEFQHNELVHFLTRSPEMRKTAQRALKQATYAGAGVLVGGLTMGPFGGLLGGLCGSFWGYAKSENYKGAISQIRKLDKEQRKRLLRDVGAVLLAAGATVPQLATAQTFRTALVTLAAQEPVRDAIWQACFQSVQKPPPPMPTKS